MFKLKTKEVKPLVYAFLFSFHRKGVSINVIRISEGYTYEQARSKAMIAIAESEKIKIEEITGPTIWHKKDLEELLNEYSDEKVSLTRLKE